MKKFLCAAAVLLAASFTSCTKDNSVKPASVKIKNLADDGAKLDLGQADGAKLDLGQADSK